MIVAGTTSEDECNAVLSSFPSYFGTSLEKELVGAGRESSHIFVFAYQAKSHLSHSYSGFLEVEFHSLVRRWRTDVKNWSSSSDIVDHPAYRRIVALGSDALPLILRELERHGPDHWFMALAEITGENPVPAEDRGRMGKMTSAWLAWGRQRKFL